MSSIPPEVIQRAQTGDKAARDQLVKSCHRHIGNVAANLLRGRRPYADLIQEGVLTLLENLHRFDPSKGVCFFTWLKPWLESAIRRQIRNDLRYFHHNEGQVPDSYPDESPHGEQPDRPEIDLACLTEQEREVVTRHFGYAGREESSLEIALSLGLSPRRVRQIRDSALRKLRRRLPND